MKKIAVILIMALSFADIYSQNEDDALRYSQNIFSGTSRFVSMGGAFGALGGDFGSISTNPAGLGVYRTSEFVFTPSFSYHNVSSSYMNSSLGDYKYRMNFENMGMVLSYNSGLDEGGWVSASFAFGYNRLADFNRNIIIEGVNHSNSMSDYFAQIARGKNSNQFNSFSEGLAWESYLIDPKPGTNNEYISAFDGTYGQVQSKLINSKGGIGEYVIAFAGNYDHKLYLGGSIGIQSVKYIENVDVIETDVDDLIPDFNHFKYHTDLKTTGSGFNFKFGAIFRPIDWLRIGGSVHTPTFFQLHDEYSSYMLTSFNSPDSIRGNGKPVYSPSGIYDYELTTPFRAIGSLGFIIGQVGLIGIDYEFVDYSIARLRSNDYMFRLENNVIETSYQAVGNVRAGGEYRYGPFAFRAGVGYYPSPYRSNLPNANAHTLSYSAGIGIRDNDFYFDIGFRKLTSKTQHFLYDPSVVQVPGAELRNSSVSIISSIGFKF